MHPENAEPPPNIGSIDHDAAIETTRPQQRRIEHVRPVGRRHHDDALVSAEAIHLGEELVEGLLTLVVPTAQTSTAMPANGVDLIDENDAGSVLFALFE